MPDSKEKRKELIREYKEREQQIGIFAIRRKATGRVFLDKTMNLDVAFNKHRFQLNMGSHRNKDLQVDWKLDGEDGFVYEIVETLEDAPEDRRQIEKELDELMELCRGKLAGGAEPALFY